MLRGLLPILGGLGFVYSAGAQNRCADTPDYFEPLTSGDGQRYPLTIGPAWHLYRVRGLSGQGIRRPNSFSIRDAIHERMEYRHDDSIGGGSGPIAKEQADRDQPRCFHKGRRCNGPNESIIVAADHG